MIIRPPVPDDAPGIAAVHVRAWRRGYEHIVGAEALERITLAQRLAFWERALAQQDPQVPHWVALDGAEVVGFAAAGPARGDPDGIGELWVLNVDPAHWRQGVGRALHDIAIGHLRSFGAAVLWVAERNDRGRAFYEALGWHADGAHKNELLFGIAFDEVRYRIELGS